MISPEAFGDEQGRGPIPRGQGWYRSPVLIIPLLICCWPIGLVLMWLFAPWSRRTKTMVTGAIGALLVLGLISRMINPPRPLVTATPTIGSAAVQPANAPPSSVPPQPAQITPTSPPVTTAPEPTEPPPPVPQRLVITGAGAEGVNMRAEPATTAARVKVLRDGNQVDIVGENKEADGRTWRNVKDPGDGATGWVAAEFVAAQAAEPSGDSVQAYLDWLQPKIEQAGQASIAMSGQFRDFSAKPALLLDQEWRLKTGVGLGLLKNAGEQMRSQPRDVPPAAANLDRDVRALGEDLVAASDDYIAGLDAADTQRLNRANQRLMAASEKINRVAPQIRALRSGPPSEPASAPTAAPAAKPSAPAKPAGGTIVCKDGYVWPGTTRQGACNGHGGIR
jgi:hypothetical protein